MKAHPFELYRLVDMLPKHWGGAVTGAKLSQHLFEKQTSHTRLLTLISQAGISSQIPPSALNLTLEAGQLLATVGAVRQAETTSRETRDLPGADTAKAELLSQAIDVAGQSVQRKVYCSPFQHISICETATVNVESDSSGRKL